MNKSKIAVAVALMFALTTSVAATTRLQKLAENRYLITHQKQTGYGGQGKAVRMAHEKAASLCQVLGYSWYEVRDTQSQGRGFAHTAAATLEVKFYKSAEKEDLNDCGALATEEQMNRMRAALEKMDNR